MKISHDLCFVCYWLSLPALSRQSDSIEYKKKKIEEDSQRSWRPDLAQIANSHIQIDTFEITHPNCNNAVFFI